MAPLAGLIRPHCNWLVRTGGKREVTVNLQSPQWIPSMGKSLRLLVEAQRARMEPNICGMKPSRLYV